MRLISLGSATASVVLLSLLGLSFAKDPEVFQFGADSPRLLDIVSKNVYPSKNAVIRELIANASDAIKKFRFLSYEKPELKNDSLPQEISIMGNEENNTLIIQDTGVGMSREQLIADLGTIARSGTKEFREKTAKEDKDLIGNYGVGFYSSFLISSRVSVISKSALSGKQYVWRSANDGSFTVTEDVDGEDIGHGTRIILDLAEDSKEFSKQSVLEPLIQQYSQFIEYPIKLYKAKTVTEEVDLTPEELEAAQAELEKKSAEKKAEAEKKKAEALEKGENPQDAEDQEIQQEDDASTEEPAAEPLKKTKSVERIVKEYVQVNHSKPIWQLLPAEVTQEQYNEFYHVFCKEKSDPLMHGHFRVEGDFNFTALVFVPKDHRYNPMDPNDLKNRKKVSLFVRKVFINDKVTDYLPSYLGFITGLIDSEDLKLNISREDIQNASVAMKPVSLHLTLKVLGMLKEFASGQPEKYLEFWKHYATSIKYGIKEDSANSKKIAELLRFHTSNEYTPGMKDDQIKMTSLADYAARAEERKQKTIYFCSGASAMEILKLPFAEAALAKGVEVLLFDEPFDQFVIKNLQEYKGMKFQDIAEADVDFSAGEESEEEKKKFAELKETFKPISDWMLKLLADEVDSVVISKKLAYSPLAVSSKAYGMSGYMMKVMNAQNGSKDNPYISYLNSMKKTVEINPKHAIIAALNQKLVDGSEPDENLGAMAKILFDSAMLASGYEIRDTKRTSTTIDLLIRKALGLEVPEQKTEKAQAEPKLDFHADATSEAPESQESDSQRDEL
jgi:HSP90 family molecular chaperone